MHLQRQSSSTKRLKRNIQFSLLLLFYFSIYSQITAQSDTLKLEHWTFRNDSSIKFEGAANLNAVVRENALKNDWDLSFRFKPD